MTEPEKSVQISEAFTVDSFKAALKGKFQTKEELDDYEKIWHLHIFQPTRRELSSEVRML